MKRGHVTGHKRERTGATDWYAQHALANIERIESAWAERRGEDGGSAAADAMKGDRHAVVCMGGDCGQPGMAGELFSLYRLSVRDCGADVGGSDRPERDCGADAGGSDRARAADALGQARRAGRAPRPASRYPFDWL
jgi:hypothetical protein